MSQAKAEKRTCVRCGGELEGWQSRHYESECLGVLRFRLEQMGRAWAELEARVRELEGRGSDDYGPGTW